MHSYFFSPLLGSGKTHTMLGPNPPRRTGTGTATPANPQGDGLMVKAIDEIFRHVEDSEKPESFRVSTTQ